MRAQLRTVLQRVAQAATASALTDKDRQVIRSALDEDPPEATDGPQPLWRWCRRADFRFEAIFGDTGDIVPSFDERYNAVLIDAGARGEDLGSPLRRMTAVVKRSALVRALRRQLRGKDGSNREIAAQLIGFAGLTELEGLLVEELATNQEQQRENLHRVVASTLISLVMLAPAAAREQGLRRLGSPDRALQTAAEIAVLAGGEPLDDTTLQRVVKGKLKDVWFTAAPDLMVRAIKAGYIDATSIREWATRQWRPPVALAAVARAVAAAADAESFEALCNGSGIDAAAWSVVAGGQPWALPALRTAMGSAPEHSMEARVAAAAIASHDFDALRGWVDGYYQCEAIIGLIAWQTRRNEVNEVLDGITFGSSAARVLADMTRAALEEPDDQERLEACWWRVLNLDDAGHAKALLRVFDARGWPLPEVAQLCQAAEDPLAVPPSERIDALAKMAGRDPTILLQRMRTIDAATPQWSRCASLVGLSGHEQAVAALYQHLATQDNRDVCSKVARTMTAAGVPVVADVRARLSSSDRGNGEPLEPDDVGEALVAAMQGHDLGRTAGLSLNTVADQVAPFLRWQLAANDTGRQERAVEIAARVGDTTDPHLSDIAALANSEVRHLQELSCPELLLACPAADVREMLASLLGRAPHCLEEVAPLLLPLMNDHAEVVSWAALGSLASLAPDRPWVTDLILERSQGDLWDTARRSAAVMATAPHPRFIHRLTAMAADENADHGARENAIAALTRIAEVFVDRGLVVLDVRRPNFVQERYGVAEQIDWNADCHSEATRLLLVAFDRRRNEDLVRRHLGSKVLFAAPDEINAGNPAHLDGATFEGLAMHFGVVFADEDSGSIIAEVREEPSGEIFNALLQTRSVAVARTSWS